MTQFSFISGTSRISQIILVVSGIYDVTPEQIVSPARHRDIAEARQMVMYVARTITRRSLAQIGGELGGRDHTTIMHGVEKVGRDIASGAIDRSFLGTIIDECRRAIAKKDSAGSVVAGRYNDGIEATTSGEFERRRTERMLRSEVRERVPGATSSNTKGA